MDQFPQAKYKSFPNQQEAQAAFATGYGQTNRNSNSTPLKKSQAKATSTSNKNFDIQIFCDGACEPNPGKASSGLAVYQGGRLSQLWYGLYNPNGTNNTAELNALTESLRIAHTNLAEGKTVQIQCDSQYSINCITNWAFGWKKNGWKKKTGEIKNLEIIQVAHELYSSISKDVEVIHVKAHAGIEGNELADRMAMYGIVQKSTPFCQYSEPLNIPKILNFKAG